MLAPLFERIFGSADDRTLKRFQPRVAKINNLEPTMAALSDQELQAYTPALKQRLEKGETLDDLLVEAFAVVREASKRIFNERPYDVQLMGGIVLHKGMISEMKTGEGKTLTSTLPVYLNALANKGVHVVTVNDYLARRDSEWMGKLYNFLGLSVGCIVHELDDDERRKAYHAEITYGTNNEFGFDYLRDNMKFHYEEMVQRTFHYAIVDEVDSILIDEARTPLIISGPTEDSSELYAAVNQLIPQLKPEDYEKDEKARAVTLTDAGTHHIEELLRQAGLLTTGGLYDVHNISLVHHVNQALRAHKLFARDVDYIVKANRVIIIDEFTGRMMEGRRYSDGLHQALEAKEGGEIQTENQTLASITFQNYFRLYPKLAGMTGTAKTEATELADIYKLEVVAIPPHRPVIRKDYDDEVYRTAGEKNAAIIKLIEECHARQQPILVGTVSIEKSEHLSELLKQRRIPHHVLNARYHEQEAYIVAQAGAPGAITIATNMAGRGTDIKLGGNPEMRLRQELEGVENEQEHKKITTRIQGDIAKAEALVKEAGGLFVIGTERHESRRIDDQLRGRSGRQGDPGASKFFLSLEDDLMRIFGSERLDSMLQRLGLKEGEAITHPWVTKALARAQQKVEARNYDSRKHVLKYDDVMNDQRKVIYELRRELMTAPDAQEIVEDMRQDIIGDMVKRFIPPGVYAEQWDTPALHEECLRLFGLNLSIADWAKEEGIGDAEIKKLIEEAVNTHHQDKEAKYGAEMMRIAEKSLLLRILDHVWKDHLHMLDQLRQGINWRAYAQRDPLNEYKNEAFQLFEGMLDNLRQTVVTALAHFELAQGEDAHTVEDVALAELQGGLKATHQEISSFGGMRAEDALSPEKSDALMGKPLRKARGGTPKKGKAEATPAAPLSRNAPCYCGSGKRYKHCHGRLEQA